MDGSPSAIITFGLGTGTFNGSPSLMVTRGLGVGEGPATTLVGQWSRVIDCHAETGRYELHATTGRIEP